jgi:hypothetical protein
MRLSVLALALALGCLAGGSAQAQLSPGELSRAHQNLDGMTSCVKCHPLGRKKMDVACLDCHQEIRWLEQKGRGLHARVGDEECKKCHPEHAGRDFELIDFGSGGQDGFDHGRSGWPLEGKHAQIRCEECHRAEFLHAPARSQRAAGSKKSGFLGLEPVCQLCHVDDHQQDLGNECTKCHSMQAFAPATAFNHDRTTFALHGAHSRVSCTKCHQGKDPDGKSMLFPKRRVEECSSCHNDPHKGRLGPKCSDCHNDVDWKKNIGANFDHSTARFPLRGAHVSVRCEKCHDATSAWGPRPAFAQCANCHAGPHAQGQLSVAADCSACHVERAFKPSTFDAAAHAKTRFPLAGAHQKLECRRCHVELELSAPRDAKNLWWKTADVACAACHPDSHGESLSRLRQGSAECLGCHDQDRWKPSSFAVTAHAKTRFTLSHKHADALCARCHARDRADLSVPLGAAVSGRAGLVFALEELRCRDCHANPHGDSKASFECGNCHDSVRWSPARIGIDEHRKFSFALDGSHAAIPCIECHTELGARRGGSNLLNAPVSSSIRFGSKTRDCKDCHLLGIPVQGG